MSKSTGYKGTMASAAAAFYAPYIPLQVNRTTPGRTWKDDLAFWTIYYGEFETTIIIDMVWKSMQKKYPGAYSVVIDDTKLTLRLVWANPHDETLFLLQYT